MKMIKLHVNIQEIPKECLIQIQVLSQTGPIPDTDYTFKPQKKQLNPPWLHLSSVLGGFGTHEFLEGSKDRSS